MDINHKLKEKLQWVKQNQYAIPENTDVYHMAIEMVNNIGSTDPELRDMLIYITFCEWMEREALSTEQIKALLFICLNEQHLFFHIGERETDSVFTRTFSMLFIPLALQADERKPFLSKDAIQFIKESVLKSIELEKDYRGFVIGKGWAHSIAHTSDAVEALAKHQLIRRDDLMDLLQGLKMMAEVNDCAFIFEEDERLAMAFISIYKRGLLNNDELIAWIHALNYLKNAEEKLPEDLYLQGNIKHFLRSVYFQTFATEHAQPFANLLLDILRRE